MFQTIGFNTGDRTFITYFNIIKFKIIINKTCLWYIYCISTEIHDIASTLIGLRDWSEDVDILTHGMPVGIEILHKRYKTNSLSIVIDMLMEEITYWEANNIISWILSVVLITTN